MTEHQLQQLREHWDDCANSKTGIRHAQAGLEQELSYLLHTYAAFQTQEQCFAKEMFEQSLRRIDHFRLTPQDRESIKHTIIPTADPHAARIYQAYQDYALQSPGQTSQPRHFLLKATTNLAALAAKKAFTEYLRMEIMGP